MIRSSFAWPVCTCRKRSSSVARPLPSPPLAAVSARRVSTAARAAFSSATTRRMSPASGTSWRPSTTTAVAGPVFATRLPEAVSSARTLPHVAPAV